MLSAFSHSVRTPCAALVHTARGAKAFCGGGRPAAVLGLTCSASQPEIAEPSTSITSLISCA